MASILPIVYPSGYTFTGQRKMTVTFLQDLWTNNEFLVIVSTADCHIHGIPYNLNGISVVWKTWKKKNTLSIQTD